LEAAVNVLIVFAHHEPSSFNAALLRTAVAALRDGGHRVEVSDLYEMGFDPVSDRRNFTTVLDYERLRQQEEEIHAGRHAGFAPVLQSEMVKLARCDLLIFHFPIWWLAMPAILKGWVDRVFACGFVYGGGRHFDRGVMKGRLAMCVVTVGGTEQDYDAAGKYAMTIDSVLLPIHRGIFEFTGFEVLPPFVAFRPDRVEGLQRRASLDALRVRMERFGRASDTPRVPGIAAAGGALTSTPP
jgi:NAD(P)H dehydrogenase (quinone)